MRTTALALVLICCMSAASFAQGSAPELFGVREVIVNSVKFSDAKVAEACGLTRNEIEEDIRKSLATSTVPMVLASEAKPKSLGIARIDLDPEIYTRADENLDCTSFVSLSAESRANVLIPPIQTLRSVTVVYWRQRTVVYSTQSTHQKVVDDAVQKMAMLFAQQYKLDQPLETPK